MKITAIHSASYPIAPVKTRTAQSVAPPAGEDQVKTSDPVRVLARSLPALRQQLEPRAGVVERYREFAEQPFAPDRATLGHLLTKIQSA